MKRALLPVVVALAGCTLIGHERVEGWPELEIVEHHVPHRVMRDRCMKYVPWYMSPEACAEFDFAARRCDLWFSADFPPPAYIVEHERNHCRGYEHVGDGTLRGILAEHVGRQDASRGGR